MPGLYSIKDSLIRYNGAPNQYPCYRHNRHDTTNMDSHRMGVVGGGCVYCVVHVLQGVPSGKGSRTRPFHTKTNTSRQCFCKSCQSRYISMKQNTRDRVVRQLTWGSYSYFMRKRVYVNEHTRHPAECNAPSCSWWRPAVPLRPCSWHYTTVLRCTVACVLAAAQQNASAAVSTCRKCASSRAA